MGTEHTIMADETGVELVAYEMSDRFVIEVLSSRGQAELRDVPPRSPSASFT